QVRGGARLAGDTLLPPQAKGGRRPRAGHRSGAEPGAPGASARSPGWSGPRLSRRDPARPAGRNGPSSSTLNGGSTPGPDRNDRGGLGGGRGGRVVPTKRSA